MSMQKHQKMNGTLSYKILLLGDSKKQRLLNGVNWNGTKKEILATTKTEKALSLAVQANPDVILLDFNHPGFQVLEFINQLFKVSKDFKVIGIMESGPLSLVTEALKSGVSEVINTREEPYKLQRELFKLAQRSEELNDGEKRHQKQEEKDDFTHIWGQSRRMKLIFEIVSKIVQRKWVTVLIRGETGTGKELIANTLHYNTFDHLQPFVRINCNALPENLLESELFGYEKGAFTDAKNQKKGLFELAQNGTLFLDEIDEVSPTVQVKLLKTLEEKKIRRLGGTQSIPIDTRIIAATNCDLQAAIREGLFRNDLFYRLNVISINLPPLRERGDDVILLAHYFLRHYVKEYESPFQQFSSDAETLLRTYDWPGNIRELKHTVERIALLGEGKTVTRQVLEENLYSEPPVVKSEKKESKGLQIDSPKNISLDEGEKILIQETLDGMAWNKRKTCEMLKISAPRLDRKIRKYNLERTYQN